MYTCTSTTAPITWVTTPPNADEDGEKNLAWVLTPEKKIEILIFFVSQRRNKYNKNACN